MLELKKITKIYQTNDLKQKALDNINIKFRDNEFVSVLGQSGSGKTTMLNIIGGLDNYTEGDLIINGKSTKKYKDRDWDTYRNHSVGFIFQSYNLIPHQTILSNVELALTLSGVSKKERIKRSKEVLKKVGLAKHMNKKPNQMSGGQMQRVAIARALVNNPDILLADEPTGALDSETSLQIMELLKEIAKDKLVIMVTHNPDLATKYSTRIVNLLDGKIINDSNPCNEKEEKQETIPSKNKKTSMSFLTALSLSLNNLLTKKGRTILTSFAGAIGIIGIALILSLSNGIQNYINRVEEDTLSSYPLTIEDSSLDSASLIESFMGTKEQDKENRDANKIYSNNVMGDMFTSITKDVKSNDLKTFKNYLESDKSDIKEYTNSIQYVYDVTMNLYKKDTSNGIVQVNPTTVWNTLGINNSMPNSFSMSSNDVFEEMLDNQKLLESQYDLLKGHWPEKYNEVVLVINKDNEISDYTLYSLGILSQEHLEEQYKNMLNQKKVTFEKTNYDYDDFLKLSFKLVLNTDYYKKEGGIWLDKSDDEEYMKKIISNSIDLNIVGIIRPNSESVTSNINGAGIIGYTHELTEYLINKNNESDIAKEQLKNKDKNVFTGQEFSNNKTFDMNNLTYEQKIYLAGLSETELADFVSSYTLNMSSSYEDNLLKLGIANLDSPNAINIYPKDFDSKEKIIDIIDKYNEKAKKNDKEEVINYSDIVGVLMKSVTSIVNVISYVLIAFVSISLVVSSIMIGIITYISVLERTKEIGILRAMGASKKDISRVFNAETFIEGTMSGFLGILITVLLNIPINIIIKNLVDISNISKLPLTGAIILVIISMILTVIAGLIPSRLASKKDPVEALRTE